MTNDPAASARKIRMYVHLTGQVASKYFDCSQQIAAALAAVDAGDNQTAVGYLHLIRRRLVEIQQGEASP